MGKDDFLKLLIAQLKYQDPFALPENGEFVAQLAQFSSLEQLQNVNTNLSETLRTNTSLLEALNRIIAAVLIGRDLKALGESLYLKQDGSVDINYELSGDAALLSVEILNSEGKVVRTINQGPVPAGTGTIRWDGKDQHGDRLQAGEYGVRFSATDSRGEEVGSRGLILGPVTGVSYEDGSILLLVGENKVPLSQVISIETGH